MLSPLPQALSLEHDQLVVVTGASGWVGRSALHELQRLLPVERFQRSVIACASRSGEIVSTGYPPEQQIAVKLQPLSALPEMVQGKTILLIHAAFLTRDRLASVGLEAYVATNRWITQTVGTAFRQAASARAIEISSGAAAAALPHQDLPVEQAPDPYGILKLQEEQHLARCAPTQVLRVYALTGRFMRDPALFALGDFLNCALSGLPIRIRSRRPVIRGYGHAADIVRSALLWLTGDAVVADPIATCSEEIALSELAGVIASLFNLPAPEMEMDPDLAPDFYGSATEPFRQFLGSLGLSALDLREQILDTAEGLRRQHPSAG
ncbi:MAG: NAD(P)-dependent oxidoreductase [Synechococcus sp. ELA057]